MFTLIWFILGIKQEYFSSDDYSSEDSMGCAIGIIPALLLDAISLTIFECVR